MEHARVVIIASSWRSARAWGENSSASARWPSSVGKKAYLNRSFATLFPPQVQGVFITSPGCTQATGSSHLLPVCGMSPPTCHGDAGGAPCAFPFTYKGKTYQECTKVDHSQSWCYTEKRGSWGRRTWGNCEC